MVVYLFVDFFIIIAMLFFEKIQKISDRRYINWFFISVSVVLILVSSLRGDFTSDYKNYVSLYSAFYNTTFAQILHRNIFTYPEIGYLLFQLIVRSLTDNVIFIFVFSSVLIVLSNVLQIKKYSSCSLIALLLFVEVGTYYMSFNLMRQVMAASITLLGSELLYKRKFVRYCIVVLIAAFFHTSALIMIPAYFVLNIKFGEKSIIFFFIITLLLLVFLPNIVEIVQKYYWSWYSEKGLEGYNWKNVVDKVALCLFTISIYYFKKDAYTIQKDNRTNIWINSSFILLLFSILGLRIALLQRFISFFSMYTIILCSNMIGKMKNKTIIIIAISLIIITYGFVTKD